MDFSQLLEYQILGEVGILVFIHQDIVETGCQGQLRLGIVPKQDVHVQEDVVEVHHAAVPAF